MPEAAIDENAHLLASKHEIRLDADQSLMATPAFYSRGAKSLREDQFGAEVAGAPNKAHYLRTLFFGNVIGHGKLC